MQLTEVKTPGQKKEFLQVPKKLYRADPNWICPLDSDIEDVFDAKSNSLFRNGEAIRWIVKDDEGNLTGRVAAFYNHDKAAKNEQPTGGMGFFECINDRPTAFLLFDACRNWLSSKGMEAMDGPVTFGENLTQWGLLIRGFTAPVYGMPYNFPYYHDLFTAYGFKTYFEQFSYEADLAVPFPDRQVQFSMHLKDKFRLEHLDFRRKEKFIADICSIYNTVWADFHEDYTPLDTTEIDKILKKAKAIINQEFIWFAYDQDKPIGLVVVFPDVNQILAKLGNGRLNLINILKFLYHKRAGTINRVRQLLTAVIPEYQRSGVTGVLFLTMVDALKKHGIKYLDMSWVGDYNTTVNKIYRLLGIPVVKTHATLRLMFDPEKEVQRFTNIHTSKHERLAGKHETKPI